MKKISLTKRKFALVDDEDYEWLSKYKWHCKESKSTKRVKKVYYTAETWINGKRVLMHRLIMNCPNEKVIDHINGDTLDNQKQNLRICTIKENSRNRKHSHGRSKYKGVSWDSFTNKWKVRVGEVWIGRFKNEELAALAYDFYALKYFREFAGFNF